MCEGLGHLIQPFYIFVFLGLLADLLTNTCSISCFMECTYSNHVVHTPTAMHGYVFYD